MAKKKSAKKKASTQTARKPTKVAPRKAARKPPKPPATRLAAKAAGAAPRPAAAVQTMHEMEAARRATREQVEKERQARMAAFRASLKSKAPHGTLALTAQGKPRILAEGDSWFDYPIPFSGGGVIDHLSDMTDSKILNLAHAGDEVRNMMGVKQRKRIEENLGDKSLAFDAFLFSGGGNDIAGDQCCLWLKNADKVGSADDALDMDRFHAALAVIECGYRDVISMRDRLNPNCIIFGHGYDTPQPSTVGVCGLGPWLKPSMDYRGWTTRADQFTIAKKMLGTFAEMVQRIAASTEKFIYVQTQGLLSPATEWANEIHPNRAGFEKVARAFSNELARFFPKSFTPN